jgi:uncharacterized integral membrane protein
VVTPMLLLALSLYLLLGLIASNACSTRISYALCLTAWPLVLVALALRTRFDAKLRYAA